MSSRRPAAASAALVALDCLCYSLRDGRLTLLIRSEQERGVRAELPWVPLPSGRALTVAVRRLFVESLGASPAWSETVAPIGDGAAHPSGAELSILVLALMPAGAEAPPGTRWCPVTALPALGARQASAAAIGIPALRDRMDRSPVAFRLLPEAFTLSELQQVYELLLGRRLHKASFRRALQGAGLVEAMEEWRSEGRGRPAQLYRYSPKRRRSGRRPVRFDLLG